MSIMITNFSDEIVMRTTNSIFLAGPTSRTLPYESSWRKEATSILKRMGFDGVVYIPEYGHGKFDESKLESQALWEREALEIAGCVVFWVPRDIKNDMPAFTTNVEFGTYMQRKPHNVSFGYPEDADKMWYMDWLYHYEMPNGVVYHTLEEILKNAIKLSKKPNPIGLFYMSDSNIDYQITAYDGINNCYLAHSICDGFPNYYQTVGENVEILDADEVVDRLEEKIKESQRNYDIWDEVYHNIGKEKMVKLFDLVRELHTIHVNIDNVKFLAKHNPEEYNSEVKRTEKGYRRKLKLVYRILGEDNYNKFVPLIEKTNYAEPSHWSWLIRNAELRKKRMKSFIGGIYE